MMGEHNYVPLVRYTDVGPLIPIDITFGELTHLHHSYKYVVGVQL